MRMQSTTASSARDWPTAAQFAELLNYNPETGAFAWTNCPANGRKAGRPVGTVVGNGYVMIRILGKLRLAHRIAWTLTHGAPPQYTIDHINRVKHDNRIANLRDVPQRANNRNCHSDPLLVGAIPAPGGKWASAVHRYNRADDLGIFDTPKQANDAWNEARKTVKDPKQPRPKVRFVPWP